VPQQHVNRVDKRGERIVEESLAPLKRIDLRMIYAP
jgi:hypothetical protein